MRQDDLAAAHRRADRGRRGAHHHCRNAGDGSAQGRLHGVPEFRPAAVAHRDGQCRVSARDRRRGRGRAPRSRAPFHRAGGACRLCRALSPRIVRRHAAAGRHRARTHAQTHSHLHGRTLRRARRADARAAAGGLPRHLVADRRYGDLRHPQHRRGADPLRSHLCVPHRPRADPHHRRFTGRRRARGRRRRPHPSRFWKMPRRIAGDAQERAMNSSREMPPRQSVPAPQPTWAQRLREVVASPNAVRTASVAVFFVVWEYYGRRMDPIFMAPPSAIFQAALELIRSGALEKALIQTLWPFSVGMALTVVIGIALGIVMAQWRPLEYVLDPFINALYAIPRIALIPLISLWAGLEFVGKVTILVSVAVFPITVNTYSGIRDVRGAMLEIGRAYGATEWQIFWKIILPAAIPFIMAGIRLAVGLAIIGIIVAEFFTAISGLGGMIVEYANVFATAKLFVPIIVIALVGVVLTEFVMWLERRMSRWRQLERERF